MKKIISLLLVLIIMVGEVFPQPVVSRSSSNNTVRDGRWEAQYNMFTPRFLDTTTANVFKGIDSCGAVIFTYDVMSIWYRSCSPKKWVQITQGTSDVIILDNVTDIISNVISTNKTLFVRDTIRGGQFLNYAGTDAVDDGMIFLDGDGNKWKRVTYDDKISIRWYGASSSASAANNTSYINAAKSYIWSHHQTDYWLYIPADIEGSGTYNVSSTINITQATKILGDGAIGNPTSKISFPAHTTGFVFSYVSGGAQFSTEIQNLYITSGYDGTFDVTKHAISTSVITKLSNVTIAQFDGDGVHISACLTVPNGDDNNYGSASNSVLENVTAEFCTNGIFITGCDANTILISNVSTNQNRRWGIYSNSFLGNTYLKIHAAFNGVPAITGANSVVTYGGLYYTANPGYDGYYFDAVDSNYNKQPDINPNYWTQVTAMSATAWNGTTRYYSGGPAATVNANAWEAFITPYTEGFQPPIWLNARSFSQGGTPGAGVTNGGWWNMFAGELNLLNSNLNVQKQFLVGSTTFDAAAQAKIYNNNATTGTVVGLKTEGSTANIYNQFANTSGTTAAYGYEGTDYVLYTGGSLRNKQTTTAFLPGADNTYKLGEPGIRWTDIYANPATGAGTHALRIDAAGRILKFDTTVGGAGGISSLNGLSGSTQTFAVGTSGTDFNINSTGTSHTFNIPIASASNRGLVTTAGQEFAGLKTFKNSIFLAEASGINELSMSTAGVSKARYFTAPTVADWSAFGQNITFDGSSFNLDNEAIGAGLFKFDSRAGQNKMVMFGFTPGTNPRTPLVISSWEMGTGVFSVGGSEQFQINNTGSIISSTSAYFGGAATPSSKVHIAAGSTSANTAPLQFTSGARETSARAGVMEYNDNYYLTKVNAVRYGVGGSLTTNVTTVGNVGTGVDDLMTYSVPAGTLNSTGDYIEFEMTFVFAGNANTKEVKVLFGATTLYASTSQVQNGGSMLISGKIVRTGAATQRAIISVNTSATLYVSTTTYTTPAETLSGAITLKATGEAVSNDDCTQVLNIVKFFPNN